jgi:hypothetical protein
LPAHTYRWFSVKPARLLGPGLVFNIALIIPDLETAWKKLAMSKDFIPGGFVILHN